MAYVAARRGPTRCAAGASGSGSTVRIARLGGRGAGAARTPGDRHHAGGHHGRTGRRRAGAPGTLFDVLYEPWPTGLAATWSAKGGAVVGGLDLLVHQAVLQVEQMTGRTPAPLAAMRTAGDARWPPADRPARRQASPAVRRETRSVRLLDRDRAAARTWEDRRRRARAAHPVAPLQVSGASMRSTVEQVALADRGGVARPRTGRDAGGPSRRCPDHHGDGGGRTWPGGGWVMAAVPG